MMKEPFLRNRLCTLSFVSSLASREGAYLQASGLRIDVKLFGILNKEQGMRNLNDEGILFAIVVLARVPRVSIPLGLRPAN